MSPRRPVVVWLRDDLRLADNPALRAAVDGDRPVVVLFVLDEESREMRELGGASRWWLHHSLAALAASLEQRGASLTLRRGAAETVLREVLAETGAEGIHWNRRYGRSREIDARLKRELRDDGLEVESHAANLLVEPWELTTGSGEGYKVYTPFWNALRATELRPELPAPREIEGRRAEGDRLDDWGLLPTRPDWAGGLRETWEPGELAARRRLDDFLEERLEDYHRRDEPGVDATSGLSPHLRFGEVSPIQIWNRTRAVTAAPAKKNAEKFLSELAWRDFNHSILFHVPTLDQDNYRPAFDAFPWHRPEPGELEAWRRGRTGIPLVDAGMRELWHTGVMHNRVRMVCASFLVKNLLIDWRIGEQWFWDTLVDADEANNPGNWQWVAGSGADAAPYFRVFNPELQAKKFDPRNEYIARWVPELGTEDYPDPIVDLKATRQEALDAYEAVKAAGRG
ncbi:cryptochrome/photolyase family protein [Homoserinibacter sp. YIM 151385]|uniref:cryptochrome/photolyase family protein n=1 Tax=Homoserinibacter sp. YIM 151385 TaxID=2985506 RepID=UPI0022F101F9|nr:deoxyribodipyrimidine photo-lyase [Homoserinibacter sp. YIM 151385]WBU37044.1 deoxyribodipyrimidine photo-lyase [Homoserinibacter sp. YIM 151385]